MKFHFKQVLPFILTALFTGCTWFSVEEYVSLTVDNKTLEILVVDTGESLVNFRVSPKSIAVSQVVKSASLKAYGETSGRHYGTRVFTTDGEVWTVYD